MATTPPLHVEIPGLEALTADLKRIAAALDANDNTTAAIAVRAIQLMRQAGDERDQNAAELGDALGQRDGAYRERARLVALVAGGLAEQAVVAPAPDVDEPGWQILYATLHGRQCSWHFAPRDADLIDYFEHVAGDDPRAQWDGHTTEAKYDHIDHLARSLGTPGQFSKD